jgi:hypothetical protein
MASALSQRQTVVPLIEATMPFSMASRAISALLSRENGRFLSHGSWQANALTSIMTLGGKTTRPAASWTILQAGQAFFKETFSPLANDLSRRFESFTDFFILPAFSSEQNGLGTDHFEVR